MFRRPGGAKLTMTSVTRSPRDRERTGTDTPDHAEHHIQRTDTQMGYYDNEPQPAESTTSVEVPAGAFDQVETQATADEGLTSFGNDDDWDDKDKKYY